MYDRRESTEEAAARLGLPADFTAMHEGHHVCIDGKHYTYSCLITDPDCDSMARSRLGELARRPRWNCLDFADGMHYVPRDVCRWCGKTREQIAREAA